MNGISRPRRSLSDRHLFDDFDRMFVRRRFVLVLRVAPRLAIFVAVFTGALLAGDFSPADDNTSVPRAGLPKDPAAYRTPISTPKYSTAESLTKQCIAIGKNTTRIDGRWTSDGLPDYFAALNEHYRHHVRTEQNAAVLLINAFGPETIPAEMRDRYFTLLGAASPAANGDYFVHCDEMVERWIRGSTQPFDVNDDDNLRGQFVLAGQQPWSTADYPMVAKWLALNERALAFVAQAADCPQFYEPIVPTSRTRQSLLTAALPLQQCAGEIKTALQARAMLRWQQGNLDAAWGDLLACHRLLRHIIAQPVGPCSLLNGSEEIELCQAELKLLHLANPSAEQIEQMRAQWTDLPPAASVADQIDIDQRYRFLDTVCLLEQQGTSVLEQLFAEASMATDDSLLEQALADPRFDWNELLKLSNEWFDRLVSISRIADRQDRGNAVQRVHIDLDQMASGDGPRLFGLKLSRRASVKMPFAALLQLCDSDLASMLETADQQTVHAAFMETGLALAAYRAEHGAYPQRLDELVPKFISMVPLDLYADHAPVHYRREENGYVLYSVGPNGLDEEAGGSDTFPDADDISVIVSDTVLTRCDHDSQ